MLDKQESTVLAAIIEDYENQFKTIMTDEDFDIITTLKHKLKPEN